MFVLLHNFKYVHYKTESAEHSTCLSIIGKLSSVRQRGKTVTDPVQFHHSLSPPTQSFQI